MSPIVIPMIGTISGTVFVGAGVSGLLSCLFGKPTWGEFMKQMGIGALTSFLSGYMSSVANISRVNSVL